MRRLLATLTAGLAVACALAVGPTPIAAAAPVVGPPFIDHTVWTGHGDGASLHVYPTPAGRAAAGELNDDAAGDEAWGEVLTHAPDADTPGMRDQFLCHWAFAEKVQPGKTSWNLEPWRPVVDENAMVDARCNPGGAEEPS